MTARPLVPDCRRRLVSAAVALVLLLALVMAAGCSRPQLCGGKFEVYE